MNESDSWSKVKSDFSQNLNSVIEGTSDTATIIKQLDELLADNNPDNQSQLELKNLISSANLATELEHLLINRVSSQKTQILPAPPNPSPQKKPATDSSVGQSSLLKSLLQNTDITLTSPIKSGQTIRGTYCLKFKIGNGGMGQVWKALDLIQDAGEAKDRYVAIKFINHEIRSHPYALKALVREFARYKKLIHPNIVKAYELNSGNNEVFIAMEYLEGRELKDFIKLHPRGIPLKQAQPIIKAMCDALEYAHSEGIIHLDFKPGNVFYNPETQICKVIDFGIARLSNRQERDQTLFDPGSLGAMTTAYASSEMLMESEPDPRDDIYGLACVVYELLSGHHPFNDCLSLKAEREKMRPKPVPGLGKDEFQALLHGLSFHRDKRTSSVKDFYSELFSPQQVATQKRTRWLIIGAIIATCLVVIPFAIYEGYSSWQLNQIKTSIELQQNANLDDFSSLTVDKQHELLDEPSFALDLVEFIISEQESSDDVLSVLIQFHSDIKQRLFADRHVQDYLINYYSNKIDQALKQNNFFQAEQLSLSILQQYPDSNRLAGLSHSIKPKKAARIVTLQANYKQCLADNTKKLTDLFPCFQQTRALLAKIDHTNALLKSPGLANRYHEEITTAIKSNRLNYADTLIAHWQSLDTDNIQRRTQLIQQLNYSKKLDDLIKQIVASNNVQLSKILNTLPSLDPLLVNEALNHPPVKQRLMAFYQETITQYQADFNFNAASHTISEAINLFSNSRKELIKLKQYAKKNELKKTEYLHSLENLYKRQLAQPEPKVKVIQDIQHNVSVLAPNNTLKQLPGLSKSYANKINIAINKAQYELAQRLLDSWKLLKPADSNTSKFTQLSNKKTKLSLALEARNNALLQLQNAVESKQLTRINAQITEIKNQFSKIDQLQIFTSIKNQLISVYQHHIDRAIQNDAFALAYMTATQIQNVFPKNKQVLAMQRSIDEAKTKRFTRLLAKSRTAINADILQGDAIFSPLQKIQSLDSDYLNKHLKIFDDLKQKLNRLTSDENPVPQLKNVLGYWDDFIRDDAQHAEEVKEHYRKTKNLIALRCLFNGRILKRQNKKTAADELIIFGLSLNPNNTVRNALEKEILQ